MILTYVVLFLQWPTWLVSIGTTAAAGIAVWKLWGEDLVKIAEAFQRIRKGHHEVKEAKGKAQLVEEQVREAAIRAMVGKLELAEFKEQQKPGQSNYRSRYAVPEPEEDPEIVEEAWRRFKAKRDEQDKKDWRKG
jgi:hypothetical protein